MFRIRDISIRWKLILIQIFTSTIVLVLCTVIFAITDINNYKEARIRSLLSMARVLGVSISPSDFLDHDETNKILQELRVDPNIINASVFDQNGNVFASYTKSGFDFYNFSFEEAKKVNYKYEGRDLYVYYKVSREGVVVRTICLHAGLSQLNFFMRQKIQIAFIVLFFGLVLTFFIASLLQKYISKPIQNLIEVIKKIISGSSYKKEVPVDGKDEIGILSSVFNSMMLQIDKRDNALSENINLLNSILKCIGEGVIVTDMSGKVVIWNPAGTRIEGYRSPDVPIYQWPEIYGYYWPDGLTILKPDDLPLIRAMKGEMVDDFEIFFRNRDLKEGVLVSFTARPLENHKGKIIGGVAVFHDITERRKMEEILRSTKQQLQDMMDNSRAIIFTKNSEGEYVFINKQYEDFFHFTKDKVIGKKDQELLPDKIAKVFSCKDEEVLDTGRSVTFEETFFLNNESYTYVFLKFPLFDGLTVPYALCCMATDITRRKKIENDLAHSLSLIRATLESTADAILVVDREGKFVQFNKRFVEMWRIPDEIIKSTDDRIALNFVLSQLKDPESFITKVREIYACPDCESMDSIEFTDGRIIERTSKPQYLKNEIIGRVWSFHDVTERKKAEEEIEKLNIDLQSQVKERTVQLSSSEKRFLALVQTANDAIISINSLGEIIYWNKAAEKIFGYTINEAIGKTLDIIIPQKYKVAHDEGMRRFLTTGESHLMGKDPIEMTGLRKGNIEFPIELSLQTYSTEEGVFFTAMIRDITNRKKAEEEIHLLNVGLEERVKERTAELELTNKALEKAKLAAEQSKAAKETFLASMSHEIRTPLNSILGFLQLLKDSPLTLEQAEYVETIDFAGKNLLVIINDILDYSKIEAGKFDFNENEFSIEEVCQSIVELIENRAREKNIKVGFLCDTKLPDFTLGDSARLSQVLLNLLGNAVKFTEKGKVQLTTRLIEETNDAVWCEFIVEDTGIGISADKLPMIFDRFTETTKDTSRKFGGTGLGLAISKRLVELQGGSIGVKSKVGEGSVFSFCLSFKKAMRKKDGNGKIYISEPTIEVPKHLKVLMAEDIELNQRLIKKIFNKTDYELEVASNGKEAIAKLEKDDYDLILMDIQMPEMDGYEATAYIRNMTDERKKKTPIVALSAYVQSGEEDKYVKMGMNGYITKPFTQKELFNTINSVMKGRGGKSVISIPASKQIIEASLYDLSYIKKTSDNDALFICDMIKLYLNNLPDRMTDLKKSILIRDYDKIHYSAHRIKNLAIPFQINQAVELTQLIEVETQENKNIELIKSYTKKLERLLDQTIESLRKEMDKLKK